MTSLPIASTLRLRCLAFLKSCIRPPQVETHDDFKESKSWAELYSPLGREENGELVLGYAKDQYNLIVGMVDNLDKKADDLMRTILTVFGAVLAVATTRLIQFENPWSYTAALGLFALALGIAVATVARIPAELQTPMQPRALMAVSDLPVLPTKSQVQSAAAASYHLALQGAIIMNVWKTKKDVSDKIERPFILIGRS